MPVTGHQDFPQEDLTKVATHSKGVILEQPPRCSLAQQRSRATTEVLTHSHVANGNHQGAHLLSSGP